MALELSLKSSALADKLPQPGQLQLGEIGLNFSAEGPFLSCCDSAGNIRRLHDFWVSKTPPVTPSPGLPWVDITEEIPVLKIYVNDAWINAIPPVVGAANELATSVWQNIDSQITDSVTDIRSKVENLDTNVTEIGKLLDINTAALNELTERKIKSEHIERGAITSDHLARGLVTEEAIAPGSITAEAIANNSITEAAIASGAITSLKLAQGAINEAAIKDGAITVEKINKDALISSQNMWSDSDSFIPTTAAVELRLQNEAKKVEAKLDSLQISAPEIGDGTITAAKLAPQSLSLGNFKQNSVAKSVENWVSSAEVVPTTLAVDQRLAAANTKNIDTGNLADGAVTESKLAKGSVTEGSLQTGSVTFRTFTPEMLVTSSGGNVSDQSIPTSAYLEKKVAILEDQIEKGNGFQLQPGSVDASHIASGSVHLGNLAANLVVKSTEDFTNTDASIPTAAAVTNQISKSLEAQVIRSPNLGFASVTEVHITNDAVTSAKIAPSAVNLSHLEPALRAQLNAIPLSKALLKAGTPTVNTDDIFNYAVTAIKIADNTLTSGQIKDGSLELRDLNPAAVLTSSEVWNPTDQTLPTSNAVDVEITNQLSKFQVSTINIADFSVTNGKLGSVSVTNDKIANSAISASKLGSGSVTLTKIDPNLIATSALPWSPTDNQVPTTSAVQNAISLSLQNLSIDTSNLVSKSVTGDKLADGSVTKLAIANSTITFNKLDPSSIISSADPWTNTNTLIPTTAAVEAQLNLFKNEQIIDNAQIGSLQIDARTIADATITGTQIADLTVQNQHIADQAIYGEKLKPATNATLGGIKVGRNLSVTPDGTLSGQGGGGGSVDSVVAGPGITVNDTDADNPIVAVIPATTSKLGGIKVGSNLAITADGTLSGTASGGVVDKVFEGPGITVDNTDIENPIVSANEATSFTIGAVKPGEHLSVQADGTLDVEAFNIVSEISALQVGKPLLIRYVAFDPAYPAGIFTIYQDPPPPPAPTTLMYYITVPNGTLTPPTFTTSSPHSDEEFEPCPAGSNKSCGGVTAITSAVATDMLWIAIPTAKANVMWQYDNPPFTGIDTKTAGPTSTITLSGTNYTVSPFNGFTKSYQIYASYL